MTARRVLVVGSFVLAAAVGAAAGTLYWLGWVMDQVDAAEQEIGS